MRVATYLERYVPLPDGYVPLLEGLYLSRMGPTIPRMVRNSFCKVSNISRMVPTSFWTVENLSGKLENVENELATRFRMVSSRFWKVLWMFRVVPTIFETVSTS
jgi:hypothetical protein